MVTYVMTWLTPTAANEKVTNIRFQATCRTEGNLPIVTGWNSDSLVGHQVRRATAA